jgi:IstB-like ATP binding protein
MLTQPTFQLLTELGLHGMAKALQEFDAQPETRALEHGDWLALLLEREATLRRQKRFETRARAAKLRHDAQVEDTDFRAVRGLDRGLFLKLAGCDFIRQRTGLLLTGPAGVGKSWLACALGQKACREDFSVAYHRAPRLFATLGLARADGRYARLLQAIARVDLRSSGKLRTAEFPSSSSTSMTGGRRNSMTISAAISSRSSKTATSGDPPSSPVRFPSIAGTKSSAIQPSPTPFSIGSRTTPIGSS